ncbi:MAG: pyridoxal-phosphate dependent enzyme [Nitrososphaerota archaeon]|nr:pyridoxal-phosphate dependent enzyme [Candidatus Bathyarchaeota archaeon]MDW8023323.1 pyridoxal-phosphate dependent enzyme [Nitrososphaerota archaeon]
MSSDPKTPKKIYRDEVHLVELDKLLQHEDVDLTHLKELTEEIASDKILKYAIAVDEATNVIIDGEHRYAALKNLGCKRIPVVYVNYASPNIQVQTWKNNLHITKRDIIEAGLSGKKFPPKTTKHLIRCSDTFSHISAVEKKVDVPLGLLKSELKIIDISAVKSAMHVEFKDVLPFYTKFLETGTVDTPIIVDKGTGVILEGYEAFYALDLLSAQKVPCFKVNIKDLDIQQLRSDRQVTKEVIIEAGLKGPKLPPRSFKIRMESFKINLPMKHLKGPKKIDKKVFRVFHSTLELLYEGWPTPLVRMSSFSTEKRSVWAKLESYNPFSNSIKDRIGWAMIFEALERGELKEALYEATSTNTGIALASIANILGIKSKLFIPKTVQRVSDVYLDVLGADVVRLPVGLTVEAIGQVDSEAKAHNAAHLNQFENDANFKVHLKYTAREIDEQLESLNLKPTCIIGGLGTSGHMSAVSLYFKSKYKDSVKIVGVQPAVNEVIPGIRRVETGMKWFHQVHFDDVIDVKRAEAVEGALKVARKEGLLIGLSAGAVVHAFSKIAEENGVYVLIFPDSGYKYAEQFEEYLTQK